MAKSGQINTNTEYDSYFWVKWEQSGDQDIPNNRTLIAWSCGVYCGWNFYKNAIWMSEVTINGSTVYGGGTYSDYSRGNHTIASGTMWINHTSEGAAAFMISSFTGWLYENHSYFSVPGVFTLDPIPRQATIKEAADFTDVDNPSISFSNPGGFRMDVWLEPNPEGDHIGVKENIPNTGSYTWELTDEERNLLRSKCSGKDCPIRIVLCTHIGNTTYSDYRDIKFTMTENEATKPTVNILALMPISNLPSAFYGLYIQGKSKVKVGFNASGKYGAKIESYSVVVDGKTYNGKGPSTDFLQTPGEVKIVAYAKDSRGFTGSAETTIDVIEYAKPLVIPLSNENAIQCYRGDDNGNKKGNSEKVWIKAGRSYHSVAGINKCSFLYRYKSAAQDWSDQDWYELLQTNSTTNEYSDYLDDGFDLKTSYTVQIMAVDTIGERDIKTFEIPTQDVAMHLGKGGKNVAIGTYCDTSEEHTFYVSWKAIFDGGVYIGDMTLKDYILSIMNGG